MKSQSAIKQNDAQMNIVITTGCPHCGWETALPALQQLKMEDVGNSFVEWQDDLFRKASITDLLQLNQSLQPDHNQTEKMMALLADERDTPLLWADSRTLWLLDFWATTFPQARFLLFYTRAESALAFALQQGKDPEQFIEAWRTNNRQLMHFQRRNRHRSLLFDAEMAIQHPETLAGTCHRIGLMPRPDNLSLTLTTATLAFERLLASQFLNEQPAIQNLQMELEASAQPLGEAALHEHPDPLEAYHSYQQWQLQIEQLTQAREEQTKLAVEHQDQIEQLANARDEQAKLVADYQAQLAQAKHAQEKRESASNDVKQENELLLLQLHQVQEELETTFLQKQQTDQARKEQDTKLNKLRQELDNTRKKLQSERKARDEQANLTADYQAQLAQAQHTQEKRESANKEVEQENELLLLQLHQVQEELETVFLQKQQIDQAQKKQDTKLRQLQQELDETRRKLQAEDKARKGLVSEQQKLQAQIEQLTKAKSEQARLATERQELITQIKQAQEKLEAANKETGQENELLLLQLHQVQEELEHYFLKYQELMQESNEEPQKESNDSEEHQEIEKTSPTKPLEFTASIRALKKPFKRLSKSQKNEKRQIELLKGSDLFDEAWYLAEYPDVAESGINPIKHYLRYGATEDRNPSSKFDTAFYLSTNPDIDATEINPLIHYIRFGREEGRPPSCK